MDTGQRREENEDEDDLPSLVNRGDYDLESDNEDILSLNEGKYGEGYDLFNFIDIRLYEEESNSDNKMHQDETEEDSEDDIFSSEKIKNYRDNSDDREGLSRIFDTSQHEDKTNNKEGYEGEEIHENNPRDNFYELDEFHGNMIGNRKNGNRVKSIRIV